MGERFRFAIYGAQFNQFYAMRDAEKLYGPTTTLKTDKNYKNNIIKVLSLAAQCFNTKNTTNTFL